MASYYPQGDSNYLYAKDKQHDQVTKTITACSTPVLVNVDYDEHGELVGVEVCW